MTHDLAKMALFKSSLMVMVALFILFQNEFVLSSVSKRRVQIVPQPDCQDYVSCLNNTNNGINIVYVNATKDNDTLHYVFSTLRIPTLMMAHSKGAWTTMKFNWTKLLNNGSEVEKGIEFHGHDGYEIDYKMAVVFTKLIEYYDFDDDANLAEYVKKNSTENLWNVRDFNTSWWLHDEVAEKTNTFSFSTHNYTDFNETNSGNISFVFRVPDSDGRDDLLPSLKYTANETLFDFILGNYTPSFNKSRFALEVVAVSQSTNKAMSIEETKSIDDEYSPGVFRVENWYMDPSRKSESGFLQWKPVCYLAESRGRAVASKVTHYDFHNLDERPDDRNLLNHSLVFALFGESLWDNITIQATNISFGLSKDGFYTGTNYTVWTAAIGYGSPPEDSISKTVIIIIACGLGLPVLIILMGGVYLIILKIRKKSEGYELLNSNTVSKGSPQQLI